MIKYGNTTFSKSVKKLSFKKFKALFVGKLNTDLKKTYDFIKKHK